MQPFTVEQEAVPGFHAEHGFLVLVVHDTLEDVHELRPHVLEQWERLALVGQRHEQGFEQSVASGQLTEQLIAMPQVAPAPHGLDRKSTRLNSSHVAISYAVFCLKKN